MTNPLGFAIVGCGTIARFHVRALAEVSGAKLVALVGRTKDAPTELAAEMCLTNIGIYSDLTAALLQPDIDVAIVCTPSGSHLELAEQAALAGKHIVVEKPLEITPVRCDQIITTCERAGVRLCTIFPSRFADSSQLLKSAITAGRFGRIALAETTCNWWRTQKYYDSAAWRGTWALDGGGALMNQAIHNVDLLQWFMGPAMQVSGFSTSVAHERIEVEDTCVATLKFANGALGVITATTAAFPGQAKTLSIHGDRGTVVIEGERIVTWQFADEQRDDADIRRAINQSEQQPSGAADPKAISHENHRRQLQDIVDAIRTGRPSTIEGRDGRAAVQLIHAIYESSRTGRIIAL